MRQIFSSNKIKCQHHEVIIESTILRLCLSLILSLYRRTHQTTHSKAFGNFLRLSAVAHTSHIFRHWPGAEGNTEFGECNWNSDAFFGRHVSLRSHGACAARINHRPQQSSCAANIQPFGTTIDANAERIHRAAQQRTCHSYHRRTVAVATHHGSPSLIDVTRIQYSIKHSLLLKQTDFSVPPYAIRSD